MPFGDRTGPAGQRPRSGRGLGFCSGSPVPGFMNRPSCGFPGWGARGWRNWFYATGLTGWQRAGSGWPCWRSAATAAPFSSEAALESLKQQASFLETALEKIRKRIQELESQPTSE